MATKREPRERIEEETVREREKKSELKGERKIKLILHLVGE